MKVKEIGKVEREGLGFDFELRTRMKQKWAKKNKRTGGKTSRY